MKIEVTPLFYPSRGDCLHGDTAEQAGTGVHEFPRVSEFLDVLSILPDSGVL